MAENIFELLQNDNPKLVEKLTENEDVCTFLMGFYAQLLYMAQGDSRNPADIRCAASIEKERLLIIRTSYAGSDSSKTDVGNRLPRQRNLNLVKFLEVNRNVRDVALNVTYCLEVWLNEKPIRQKSGFKGIKLENGMRWKDGTFTVEIILKVEFDDLVNEKMNWETDEPEQPTEEGSITQ